MRHKSEKILIGVLFLEIIVLASIIGSLLAYAGALLVISVVAVLAFIVPNTNPKIFLLCLTIIAGSILAAQQMGANQVSADDLLKSNQKRFSAIIPKDVLLSDSIRDIETTEWDKTYGTKWKTFLNWNISNELFCRESPLENLQNFFLYRWEKPQNPWRARKMICANIYAEILLGIAKHPEYLRIGTNEAVMVKQSTHERTMVRLKGDSIYFSQTITE